MKNIRLILDKEKLQKHLLKEYMSYEKVALLYNICRNTVRKLAKEYNIKIPKEITQLTREKTNIEKYGNKTPLKNELVQYKAKQTSLKKYNCEKAANNKEIRYKAGKNIKLSRIKNHTTNKELMQSNKIYKEGLTRKEYFNKQRSITLHKNNSYSKSKEELYILNLLREKFKNVQVQYRSELYPFNCDFYIESINTYIEYQGYWCHGKYNNKILGPYNLNNKEHQIILNIWKEKAIKSIAYKHAIEVWTIKDPLKRQIAKENSLKLLEFWNIEDFLNWYKLV